MVSYCAGLVQAPQLIWIHDCTRHGMFRRHHVIACSPCPRYTFFSVSCSTMLLTLHLGEGSCYKIVSFMTEHQDYFKLNSTAVLFFELLDQISCVFYFQRAICIIIFLITLSISRGNTQLMLHYPSPNSGYKCVMCKDSHSLEKPPFSFNHSR